MYVWLGEDAVTKGAMMDGLELWVSDLFLRVSGLFPGAVFIPEGSGRITIRRESGI